MNSNASATRWTQRLLPLEEPGKPEDAVRLDGNQEPPVPEEGSAQQQENEYQKPQKLAGQRPRGLEETHCRPHSGGAIWQEVGKPMAHKRKPIKPVGKTGVMTVTAGLSGGQTTFKKLDFPRTKEEIEEFIVKGFLKAAREANLLSASVSASQNEQNSFDFLLLFNGDGKKYMELMEIAPLEHLRGTYDSAPASYKPYDFASYIFEKVMKKSAHYGSVNAGLILLLYITAWQFVLSQTVIALLQFWLTHTEHKFEGVYCYCPMTVDSGAAHLICPTPKEFWSGFDPEKFRNTEVLNFDLSTWQIISK
jgi:hypothetical protein